MQNSLFCSILLNLSITLMLQILLTLLREKTEPITLMLIVNLANINQALALKGVGAVVKWVPITSPNTEIKNWTHPFVWCQLEFEKRDRKVPLGRKAFFVIFDPWKSGANKPERVPCSSGYGWWLMFKRSWVQILALYTG